MTVASPLHPADLEWVHTDKSIDFEELSELYRVAPLGEKPPEGLRTVFANSMSKGFVYAHGRLIGAGRAIADGLECAYIADVAVHPDFQGRGLGKAIISRLVGMAKGHKKIILYANPGTEGFSKRSEDPQCKDKEIRVGDHETSPHHGSAHEISCVSRPRSWQPPAAVPSGQHQSQPDDDTDPDGRVSLVDERIEDGESQEPVKQHAS